MENCPICHQPPKVRCRCPRGDSTCENGHEWHTCMIHHVIVLGLSDHSTPTLSCTCHDHKVVSKLSDTVKMSDSLQP